MSPSSTPPVPPNGDALCAPSERVRREMAAKIGERQRVASRSSPIAYIGLACLLAPTVPVALLALWVGVLLTCNGVSDVLRCRLARVLDDPAARERTLARMRGVHWVMGCSWGGVILLVPLDESIALMLCTMFLAVVAMFSVHNVAYDRRALVALDLSMALPSLVWVAASHHPLAPTVGVIWALLLPMVFIYANAVRSMFLSDLGSRLSLEAVSSELRENNASLAQALATIEALARIDPLTGALNRRAGMEALQSEAQAATRAGSALGIVMIDLDDFKRINDTRGHMVGDAVLVEAAARLKAAIRPTDHLARWGGEEFLVLLCRSDALGLADVVHRLREAIGDRPFHVGGTSVAVTASMGLALASSAGTEASLTAADVALYEAKRSGRNRVVVSGEGAALALAAIPSELR